MSEDLQTDLSSGNGSVSQNRRKLYQSYEVQRTKRASLVWLWPILLLLYHYQSIVCTQLVMSGVR